MPASGLQVRLAICLALSIVVGVEGWWCTGHMLVAEIARSLAATSGGPTSEALESTMRYFVPTGPWPENPNSVELACWADDIKPNQRAFGAWHYIDLPWNPRNETMNRTAPQTPNVVTQILSMTKSLNNNPNAWERAFSLAWLTHLYGDIHQPLHCIGLYNGSFMPDGDLGGNLFKIYVNGSLTNLHAYWDSVCGDLGFDFPRPLNATTMGIIQSLAASLMAEYPISVVEARVIDPQRIALESFMDAIDFVYADLQPFDNLTSAYHDRCQSVAKRRIVLAGYRLATVLTRGFDPTLLCDEVGTNATACDAFSSTCGMVNGSCRVLCSKLGALDACSNVSYCMLFNGTAVPPPSWEDASANDATLCRITDCSLLSTQVGCSQYSECSWSNASCVAVAQSTAPAFTTTSTPATTAPGSANPVTPNTTFGPNTGVPNSTASFLVMYARVNATVTDPYPIVLALSALIPYPLNLMDGAIFNSQLAVTFQLSAGIPNPRNRVKNLTAVELAPLGIAGQFHASPVTPTVSPPSLNHPDSTLVIAIVAAAAVLLLGIIGVGVKCILCPGSGRKRQVTSGEEESPFVPKTSQGEDSPFAMHRDEDL